MPRNLSSRRRARRKRTKLSEERLRLAAVVESSDNAIISKDLDATITSWNAGAQRIFGYSEEEAVGQAITILIPPDLREEENKILEILRAGERIDHYETTRITKAGKEISVSLSISPISDSSGKITGFSKIARDISERKQAVAELTRKLIEAQEQERARIGRELHDNISQKLAMLVVGLEQLENNPSDVERRVQQLRKETVEVSNEVQAVAHELHSSALEHLGSVAAIKSWCREFSERHRIQIQFKSDVSSTVPAEIGLCLLRVLQEALHNAVKYSGVKWIEVQMAEHSNEVHLTVNDSGIGFNIEAAKQGRGLGLTSMEERVKLVNGMFSIESQTMMGTKIDVRIPLRTETTQPDAFRQRA